MPKFLRLTSVLIVFFAFSTTPSQAQSPNSYFEDAAIRALHFVDSKEGWAVGDEGVVWHTINGGKDWERQPTGTRASLKSIHFLSPYFGWVVGTEYHPTLDSVGVILFTRDGGIKWTKVLHNSMPGLNFVKFLDNKIGILAGDATEAYPAGFFFTTDGGKSWEKGEGPKSGSWYSAALTGKGSGFLAGSNNSISTLVNFKHQGNEASELTNRSLKSAHTTLKSTFLVGLGSQILASDSQTGATWTTLNTGLSSELANCIDFHSIHGTADHLWVAGKPGSILFHSPDAGKTWEIVKTNNKSTLNSIFFTDPNNGWTAGEYGTILATKNAGKTWQVQKRGASHSRILIIQAGTKDFSPETSAFLGFEKNNIVSSLTITSMTNQKNNVKASSSNKVLFYSRKAGNAHIENYWQFPISSLESNDTPQKVIENWDRILNNKSADQLLNLLVLSIRSIKPEIIILANHDHTEKDAVYQVIKHATIQAVEKANTPDAFNEQLKILDLSTWKTNFLIQQEFQSKSHINFDLTQPLNSIQGSLLDFADSLRSCLEIDNNPNSVSFFAHINQREKSKDLLIDWESGLTGINRRQVSMNEELIKEKINAIRNSTLLRKISESPLDPDSNSSILLSKMQAMVSGLPEEQAASLLSNIAMLFFKNGQWSASREIFKLIISTYPTTQESANAIKWLIFHDGSSETRRRHELGQFISILSHEFGKPSVESIKAPPLKDLFSSPQLDKINQTGGIKGSKNPKKITVKVPELPLIGVNHKGEIQTLNSLTESRAWLENSLKLEAKLSAFGPLAEKDPRIFFSTNAACRNLGKIEESKSALNEFLSNAPPGPWKQNALAELWITERRGQAPKEVFTCKQTDTKPVLDGKLDDECWKSAKAIKLTNWIGVSALENHTEFKTLYDSEFLYISATCSSSNLNWIKPKTLPTRDQTLIAPDQIFFQIDLDRDYSTCYQFQVDSFGNVIDDCWGDNSWNPKWFFVTKKTDTGWTFEAAIPMGMLSSSPATAGKSWAVNFGRTILNQGVQTWSSPAKLPNSNDTYEGLGLLFFINHEPKTIPDLTKP